MSLAVLVVGQLDEVEVEYLCEERVRLEVNEEARVEDVAREVELRDLRPRVEAELLAANGKLLDRRSSRLKRK